MHRIILIIFLLAANILSAKAQKIIEFNLYFETGKYELQEAHKAEIDKQIKQLTKSYSQYRFDVVGHSDNIGSADFNLGLSGKRSKVVAEYFVSKTVKPEEIFSSALWFSKPIASNAAEKGRAVNRRVSVTIQLWEDYIIKNFPIKVPATVYKRKAEDNILITYSSGSKISIPSNSLIDENGTIIKGKVEIHYREYHNQAEFIASGVPMSFDSNGTKYYYHSGGMFELQAYQNNKRLQLRKAKLLTVDFAVKDSLGADMKFYQYTVGSDQWTYHSRRFEELFKKAEEMAIEERKVKEKDKPKNAAITTATDSSKVKMKKEKIISSDKKEIEKKLNSISLSVKKEKLDEDTETKRQSSGKAKKKKKKEEEEPEDTAGLGHMIFGAVPLYIDFCYLQSPYFQWGDTCTHLHYIIKRGLELTRNQYRFEIDTTWFKERYQSLDYFDYRKSPYTSGNVKILPLKKTSFTLDNISYYYEFIPLSYITWKCSRSAREIFSKEYSDARLYPVDKKKYRLELKDAKGIKSYIIKSKTDPAKTADLINKYDNLLKLKERLYNKAIRKKYECDSLFWYYSRFFMTESERTMSAEQWRFFFNKNYKQLERRYDSLNTLLDEDCSVIIIDPPNDCLEHVKVCHGCCQNDYPLPSFQKRKRTECFYKIGRVCYYDTCYVNCKIQFGGVSSADPLLQLASFGMYNWDAVKKMDRPVEITANFKNEKGESINAKMAFLADAKINGVLSFNRIPYSENEIYFFFSPYSKNALLVIDSNLKIYLFKKDDFSKYKFVSGNKYTLNVQEITQQAKTAKDLQKLLELK
jgi:hypothetical protein